ncbi:MAG: hypothetical protein KR126chlam1_00863 [Chlamydiae bacterium]|nr:hypothetical protein [Chlamydiota bacterium]
MIQAVTASQSSHFERGENIAGISTLWGRVTRDWEKVLVFSNIALILSGIAILYFMNYPALAIGMGIYGLAYTALNGLVQRARVASNQNSGIERPVREDWRKKLREIKDTNEDFSSVLEAIERENSELTQQLQQLRSSEAERVAREMERQVEINRLRSENASLKQELTVEGANLAESVGELESLRTELASVHSQISDGGSAQTIIESGPWSSRSTAGGSVSILPEGSIIIEL